MKRYLISAIILSVGVVCLSLSIPGYSMQGAGDKGLGEGPGVMWRLDLTNSQKDAINAREMDVEKELIPLKQTMRDLKYQLNQELSSDQPDKARVYSVIEKTSNVMLQIQEKNINFMLWMRAQLSPEQKQKLKALMQSREGTEEGR